MKRFFAAAVLCGLALTGQTVFRNPSTGAVIATVIRIIDVQGLQAALNIRPTMGNSYTQGRVAWVDNTGLIGSVGGNAGDCVHVDGSTGTCGTGGGGGGDMPLFVDHETPAGSVNGSNAAFTVGNTPTSGTLSLFRNGLLQRAGTDFTLSGAAITFAVAPGAGDWLDASYRH